MITALIPAAGSASASVNVILNGTATFSDLVIAAGVPRTGADPPTVTWNVVVAVPVSSSFTVTVTVFVPAAVYV